MIEPRPRLIRAQNHPVPCHNKHFLAWGGQRTSLFFSCRKKKVQRKSIFSFSSFEVHLQRAPSLLKEARFSGRGLTPPSNKAWLENFLPIRAEEKTHPSKCEKKCVFNNAFFFNHPQPPPLSRRKFAVTEDLPQREPHYGFRKINAHHPTPLPPSQKRNALTKKVSPVFPLSLMG